jgi:hypothetical protein
MSRLRFLAAIIIIVCFAFKPAVGAAAELADSALHVHVVNAIQNNGADQFAITLRVDPGYHINANPATFGYLIPTMLNFVGLEPLRVTYPASVLFRTKFASEEIAVYEGTVVIASRFPKGELGRVKTLQATVTVQACTDIICFAPSRLPVSWNTPSGH